MQRDDDLYHAGVNSLLDVVAEQDEGFNSIMLVGHNPGFTDLANYLSPGLTGNLPTCGVVSVSLACDDWKIRDCVPGEILVHDWPKKAN